MSRDGSLDMFEEAARASAEQAAPLADRMRPRRLDAFWGHREIVGPDRPLRRAIEADRLFSMILWGPPGCGKTTLARIIAEETRSRFVQVSAVLSGVKEIRSVIDGAKADWQRRRKRTLLFVDEIHRFNKSQQDAFLHHVETGLITLVGATTENPSFEVIPALVSRCRVFRMGALSGSDLGRIIDRALADTGKGLGGEGLTLEATARDHLIRTADGDARTALSNLEMAAFVAAGGEEEGGVIRLSDVERAIDRKALRYDKSGEGHYNLISALHKSLRGSDPDAAIYWLCRMLAAGEDPLYVARRMVQFASEDVGNADTNALTVALNATESYRFLGSPEGELALVQAAAYLATAPKSNRVYAAQKAAEGAIRETGSLPVPLHIRNAPTGLMKEMGYGKGYQYAHDYADAATPQVHLPDRLAGAVFYSPSDRGEEAVIGRRLEKWRRLRERGGLRVPGDAPVEGGPESGGTDSGPAEPGTGDG
jgi:putative ATPase